MCTYKKVNIGSAVQHSGPLQVYCVHFINNIDCLLCVFQEGGVSGFLHAFICEVFAMVRAHVAALGGNAVVSYIMKQCVFMENTNKNQVISLS